MPHRFNERFGNICAGNAVAKRQGQGALADIDCALAARPVEEESDADNRVVQSATADLVFDASTPNQRIPLEQVDQETRQ